MVDPGFSSFVGRISIPLLHGMTVGELGLYFQSTFAVEGGEGGDGGEGDQPQPPSLHVTVVQMTGWNRGMSWEDTKLPWVLTSPNMPTLDTVRLYPGMCLIEGTTMSEGRGTTQPFQMIGGSWLNYTFQDTVRQIRIQQERQQRQRVRIEGLGETVATNALLSSDTSDGLAAFAVSSQVSSTYVAKATNTVVLLREAYFIPTSSKCKNNITTGINYILGTEYRLLQPLRLSLEVLATAIVLSPPSPPSPPPSPPPPTTTTRFQFLNQHFDALIGSNKTRYGCLRLDISFVKTQIQSLSLFFF